jgi:hypothetical protein
MKLESFNRDLLSIVIQFQNGDETYKVPIDFVISMISGSIDFDVNNLEINLSHHFNMSMLVSSDIGTIDEFLRPKVYYYDQSSFSFSESVKGSIQAIVNGVATLEYDECSRLSRFRNKAYPMGTWTKFLAKVWLCRAPKMIARGFKVDMEQLPVFHTQAEIDAQTPDTEEPTRCPYCLDNDDKDQVFVTLACCGNKVHASCHFENISTNNSSLDTLRCCMCRQKKGIQMQHTEGDFMTSFDEFEKLMLAVGDMQISGSDMVNASEHRRRVSEHMQRIRQEHRRRVSERMQRIRQEHRRRGVHDYNT